jgi:polysaccharide export outer membrane protein
MDINTIIVKLVAAALCASAAFANAQESEDAGQSTDRAVYRVNAGDTLEISVWKEEDLQRQVLVRPDGGFSFPLAGELLAEGRTVREIREELESRLGRYIPDLVSTVTVVAVTGNSIFVIGQVNKPGTFIMNPVLDVMQALSLAGGMTPFASLKNIRILRRENGVQTAIRFDFTDVAEGRSLEQNIQLRSGDVVVVP